MIRQSMHCNSRDETLLDLLQSSYSMDGPATGLAFACYSMDCKHHGKFSSGHIVIIFQDHQRYEMFTTAQLLFH